MPGRALMTEYRRSYRTSQFRCAATTYHTNREFRLQQLQRFQNHSTDPFIWPDDEDDDYDEDDVTPTCGAGSVKWIIIGSDRRPETKQGIEGKIARFRLGRVRDRVRVRDKDRRSEPDRRSEAISFGAC